MLRLVNECVCCNADVAQNMLVRELTLDLPFFSPEDFAVDILVV